MTGEDQELGPQGEDALQPFSQAYYAYSQSFEDAWTPSDIQQRGTETFQRYVQATQEVEQPGGQERLKEAWNDYLQVVQDALANPAVQSRSTEAYHVYLQGVVEAWKQIDLTTVSPVALLAIGQSITSAAWLAAAANGTADQLTDLLSGS